MTRLKFKTALLVLPYVLLIATLRVQAEPVTLAVQELFNPNDKYCHSLLQLALGYSGEQYQYQYKTGNVSQTRGIEQLNSKIIDVYWTGTTVELENALLPIRVPLYRGLLGYRVLMIRRGTQNKFNHITDINQLREMTLGQGTPWPDTAILEANQFKVVKTMEYDDLFHMLDGGRFDAFPRGILEPWAEMAMRPEMAFEVEKNLMLVYYMPFYFFVGKNNPQLHAKIESGLEKAIQDGSFDQYFFSNELIKNVIEKADAAKRIVFRLDNPHLPPNTPTERKELWVDPAELTIKPTKPI